MYSEVAKSKYVSMYTYHISFSINEWTRSQNNTEIEVLC